MRKTDLRTASEEEPMALVDMNKKTRLGWPVGEIRLLDTGPSSAFKKWSGHVVQRGSRKGMFGYLPREKFRFTTFLDPMLLHLERVLGLRKM